MLQVQGLSPQRQTRVMSATLCGLGWFTVHVLGVEGLHTKIYSLKAKGHMKEINSAKPLMNEVNSPDTANIVWA